MTLTTTKTFVLILLGGLLLAACQPAIPTPLPDITLPAPTLAFSDFPHAAQAARDDLATQLNLSSGEVKIEQVIPALWPNSCLGLGGADEACLQVITSGYLVTLSAGGKTYEYRTDIDGSQLRPVPPGMEKPAAVDAAISTLAEQLGIDPSLISLAGFDAVDWPDSCLGVSTPDVMCAQVITPGYRVVLSAAGKGYELHTNQDGSQVIVAPLESSQPDIPVITLKTEDPQAGCQEFQVTRTGLGSGACGSDIEIEAFPGMQRAVELEMWLARYAPFEVTAADGSLSFEGRGTQKAVLAEQRALIAWTRLVALDLESPPSEPPPGLVIDWYRTGGLAGVCDRLMIFESGFAYARDCQQNSLGQTLLQTDQIKLLYEWRDAFKPAKVNASDGVTDGYNYELLFNGAGSSAPTSADQKNMLVLAAQLFDILTR